METTCCAWPSQNSTMKAAVRSSQLHNNYSDDAISCSSPGAPCSMCVCTCAAPCFYLWRREEMLPWTVAWKNISLRRTDFVRTHLEARGTYVYGICISLQCECVSSPEAMCWILVSRTGHMFSSRIITLSFFLYLARKKHTLAWHQADLYSVSPRASRGRDLDVVDVQHCNLGTSGTHGRSWRLFSWHLLYFFFFFERILAHGSRSGLLLSVFFFLSNFYCSALVWFCLTGRIVHSVPGPYVRIMGLNEIM